MKSQMRTCSMNSIWSIRRTCSGDAWSCSCWWWLPSCQYLWCSSLMVTCMPSSLDTRLWKYLWLSLAGSFSITESPSLYTTFSIGPIGGTSCLEVGAGSLTYPFSPKGRKKNYRFQWYRTILLTFSMLGLKSSFKKLSLHKREFWEGVTQFIRVWRIHSSCSICRSQRGVSSPRRTKVYKCDIYN